MSKRCQERNAARIRQLTATLEAWTSILNFGADLFRQMRPRFALASETIRTSRGFEFATRIGSEANLETGHFKLMKIPAFLWAYTKFGQAKAWLEATEAWQAIRAISKAARQYVTEMKKSAAVAFRQS